jgi:hypothetical protein
MDGVDTIEQWFALRRYTLEILYDDGRNKKFTPIRVESAIVNFEKFSLQSKRSYANF